jgi:hypothetical protein
MTSKHFADGWHPFFHRIWVHVDEAAKSEDGRVQTANCFAVAGILAVRQLGTFHNAHKSVLNG